MKKYLTIFVCLLSALFFAACQKQDTSVSKTGFYFDTVIKVTLYDADAEPELESCFALADKYEKLLSATKKGSDIWNINHAKGKPVVVSKETISLLQKAIDYSELSDGAFDITIGKLSSLWDFGENKDTVPSQKDINAALPTVDYHNIEISDNTVTLKNPKTQIDLGGIAKGYLSQKLVELFQKEGAVAGVVSLGGNVQTFGKKEDGSRFTIGITDPSDGQSVLGTLEGDEKAVITSGSYQRYFEENGKRYHHIMDPRTGAPAESDLLSVTVICDRGEQGDALATSLFVMGKEKAIAYAKENNLSLILVDQNNEIWTSEGVDFRTAK